MNKLKIPVPKLDLGALNDNRDGKLSVKNKPLLIEDGETERPGATDMDFSQALNESTPSPSPGKVP